MYHSPNQRHHARQLRTQPTEAEQKLWQALRGKQLGGWKFRRQAAIGIYIVDFVCFETKLIVEVEGGQHNEPAAREYDARRTAWLKSQGFEVIRFWNCDVLEDIDAVVEGIALVMERLLAGLPPTPSPSPPGGGE